MWGLFEGAPVVREACTYLLHCHSSLHSLSGTKPYQPGSASQGSPPFRGLDMADMAQHTHRLDLTTHSAPCTSFTDLRGKYGLIMEQSLAQRLLVMLVDVRKPQHLFFVS